MLVANPGHTPYSFNSKTNFTGTPQQPFTKLTTGETTASTSKSSLSTLTIPSASHIVENLKSLSVRLNRGTQIIKETVQRVLLPKSSSQLSVTDCGAYSTAPVIAPTNAHRSPRKNTASTDSLNIEMCHFKPIRAVPKTPNKKSMTTVLQSPKAIKMEAVNLKENLIQSPKKSTLSDLFLLSRSSAFYHVKSNIRENPSKPSTTSLSSDTTTNCTIINNHLLSPEEIRKFLSQKQVVVRLKRCQFPSTKDTGTKKTEENPKTSSKNNTKRKPPKRRLNGRVTKTKNSQTGCQKTTPKDSVTESINSNAPENVYDLQNVVKEEKKYRQHINEEKLDYAISLRTEQPLSKRTRRGRGAPNSVATPIERNLRRRTRKQY